MISQSIDNNVANKSDERNFCILIIFKCFRFTKKLKKINYFILIIYFSAFTKCVRRSITNLKYDVDNFHKRFDAHEYLENIPVKMDSEESSKSNMIIIIIVRICSCYLQ